MKVRTDDNPTFHMHNKFVIVDDLYLITGSFNWTKNASTRNDENLIVLEGENLAALYDKYIFQRITANETSYRLIR